MARVASSSAAPITAITTRSEGRTTRGSSAAAATPSRISPGLVRGIVGGALYGGAILVVRSITGWSDEADLGATPGFLIVITTIVGMAVGAAGGAVRARRG